MLKFVSGVALFALIGIGACGFAASQAQAYSCYQSCQTIGGMVFCQTNCY